MMQFLRRCTLSEDRFDKGMAMRKSVLGAEHVERAEAGKTEFDADYQRYITENAWGTIWTRPGLDKKTRHMLTIAMLAALGKHDELAMHIRATRNTGVTPEELREVLLHVSVYAGVPSANSAFAIAKRVYKEIEEERKQQTGACEMKIQPYKQRDWKSHPPYTFQAYGSSVKRGPSQKLVPINQTLSEITGPLFSDIALESGENDLTRNPESGQEAMGERIIVVGRVLDEDERPIANSLIEIWQANAAGRYRHPVDQHNAPLDPNFIGAGRCITNAKGEYRFSTIKPGAYPWLNHTNAWRPAHIHLSLFGPSFVTRLVTQFFFPGDPLLEMDPILSSIPTKAGRQRLIAAYAHDVTEPEYALGYRFDIVLRGRQATPFEQNRR
jgi:protocatechuate 3,4-dioxygenase, beta subunit